MTRHVLPSVPRSLSIRPSDNSPRRTGSRPGGEPVVTAIWMTVSAATLVLGFSLPYLGAVDSPLQGYVVPVVALMYALAMGATCAYNRLRYGRVWLNPLRAPRRRRRGGQRRRTSVRRAKAPLAIMIG
jgi:hypothetical protein